MTASTLTAASSIVGTEIVSEHGEIPLDVLIKLCFTSDAMPDKIAQNQFHALRRAIVRRSSGSFEVIVFIWPKIEQRAKNGLPVQLGLKVEARTPFSRGTETNPAARWWKSPRRLFRTQMESLRRFRRRAAQLGGANVRKEILFTY